MLNSRYGWLEVETTPADGGQPKVHLQELLQIRRLLEEILLAPQAGDTHPERSRSRPRAFERVFKEAKEAQKRRWKIKNLTAAGNRENRLADPLNLERSERSNAEAKLKGAVEKSCLARIS